MIDLIFVSIGKHVKDWSGVKFAMNFPQFGHPKKLPLHLI